MRNQAVHTSPEATLVAILEALFEDLSSQWPEFKHELALDRRKAVKRVHSEGIVFLTKTLPLLGKSFDEALQGQRPLTFPGFRRNGAIPKFLGSLLGLVFSKTTGFVLDKNCVSTNAVADLRQLFFMFYKLELPYESATLEAAFNSFKAVDDSLPVSSDHLSIPELGTLTIARALVEMVLEGINPFNIVPKHGPGEVAMGEKPHEKYNFSRRYSQLDDLFPFEEWFLLSPTHYVDMAEDSVLRLDEVEFSQSYARLAFVSKDSRGPRLIVMYPLELMWIQQGLKTLLYDWIESHTLTKGFVNFTDQTINRELALKSSQDQSDATLDLKDASDSISMWLVEELYSGTELYQSLLATRVPHVQWVQGDKIHVLENMKKFAPMGSALTFPIEALTFWALAVASIANEHHMPLALAVKQVHVYGDDIIVPTQYSSTVVSTLPVFGLKINTAKSCTHGYFRESCGMDAFQGESVTPIRLKALPPMNRRDVNSLVAYVDQSNLLWMRGYCRTALALQTIVESVIGVLPSAPGGNKPFLCWQTRVGAQYTSYKRWNADLQCYQRRYWAVETPSMRISTDDSWSEILRCVMPHDPNLRAGVYPRRYKLNLRRVRF